MTRSMLRRLFLSLLVPLGLAACLYSPDASWRRVREAGCLRIGYAVEAPYAFLSPDGEVTGESPEIARKIARRLGIARVEWQLVRFDELLDELEAHRFDMVAAGMFITPERSRTVSFSRPTFEVGSALLVRTGRLGGCQSYAELSRTREVKVAVLNNSVEEKELVALGPRRVAVPDALCGQTLVETDQVDGLALSSPTLRWMARSHPGKFEVLEMRRSRQRFQGGFVFRREDQALREAWNRELDGFLRSPEHWRLVQQFGFRRAEVRPDP